MAAGKAVVGRPPKYKNKEEIEEKINAYFKPDIYVNGTTPTNKGLGIVARFNTTTNAVNNSPIGIDVSLRVTFA